MNDRAFVAGLVLSVAVATAVMLTGCAAIQRSETRSTEHLLAAAGFELRPADTAEQQQHLAALPPFLERFRTVTFHRHYLPIALLALHEQAFLVDRTGTIRGARAYEDAEVPDFDELLAAAKAL